MQIKQTKKGSEWRVKVFDSAPAFRVGRLLPQIIASKWNIRRPNYDLEKKRALEILPLVGAQTYTEEIHYGIARKCWHWKKKAYIIFWGIIKLNLDDIIKYAVAEQACVLTGRSSPAGFCVFPPGRGLNRWKLMWIEKCCRWDHCGMKALPRVPAATY